MVKHVFSRICPAALTGVGWACFALGVLIEAPTFVKLVLLTVARVLP